MALFPRRSRPRGGGRARAASQPRPQVGGRARASPAQHLAPAVELERALESAPGLEPPEAQERAPPVDECPLGPQLQTRASSSSKGPAPELKTLQSPVLALNLVSVPELESISELEPILEPAPARLPDTATFQPRKRHQLPGPFHRQSQPSVQPDPQLHPQRLSLSSGHSRLQPQRPPPPRL